MSLSNWPLSPSCLVVVSEDKNNRLSVGAQIFEQNEKHNHPKLTWQADARRQACHIDQTGQRLAPAQQWPKGLGHSNCAQTIHLHLSLERLECFSKLDLARGQNAGIVDHSKQLCNVFVVFFCLISLFKIFKKLKMFSPLRPRTL